MAASCNSEVAEGWKDAGETSWVTGVGIHCGRISAFWFRRGVQTGLYVYVDVFVSA